MFWIVVAVVALVLLAIAWWSSGRAKGRAPSPNAAAVAQAGAMKHYRPPNPPGNTAGSF